MRILHAIHDFLPRHQAGSEIYAFELCRELASRHHVSVLCAEHDLSREDGHVKWRVHQGLPVIEIANNWRCASFEDTYRPRAITDRIAHVLQAVQPEVIHIHNLLNLSFDLPALAKAQGVPVVATLHDYTLVCPSGGQRIHRADRHVCHAIEADRCVRCFRESTEFALISVARLSSVTRASRLLRRPAAAMARRFPPLVRGLVRAARRAPLVPLAPHDIERRLDAARKLFDEVDLFIAPSPSIAAEFERLGVNGSKIRIADYGLVPVARRPRAEAQRTLRIGYVGTIVWHKGVHVLLDAVRGLPSTAYELKIFGSLGVSPEYVGALREQAAGLPVRFMGAFDREGVADAYAQIDLLVVPSLWLENSPLVIHEAFMAGIPVVAARIGGIVNLVEDGRTGLLYDPTSAAALEAALRSVMDNPGYLRALSERAGAVPRIKSIAEDAVACESIYADLLRGRSVSGLPA
ncbi:MAG: glycosyltransferase [Acidobacteria bacterium]|nr:glycosyltransferase [Acidobacteriota bacterium]